MMCDDYCNSESERGCSKIWDRAFTKTYDDAVKGRKDIDFADAKQDAYKGNEFYAELCHVVDTQCLMDLGIIKDKAEDISAGSVKQKIEAAARNRDRSDTRSASEILADMRDDYMKQMTPQELTALMVHVGTNMEQGMRANHRYARHGMEDASEKLVKEYTGTFDASPTGAVVKDKNGQEASTPNSQKVDMNIDFGVDDDDDYSIDISDLQA